MPRGQPGAELTHSLHGTSDKPRSRSRRQVCLRPLSRVGRNSSASGRHCDYGDLAIVAGTAPARVSVDNQRLSAPGIGRFPLFRCTIVILSATMHRLPLCRHRGQKCPILKVSQAETVCLSLNSLRIPLFGAAAFAANEGNQRESGRSRPGPETVFPVFRSVHRTSTCRSARRSVRRSSRAHPRGSARRWLRTPGQRPPPSGCRRPWGSDPRRSRARIR